MRYGLIDDRAVAEESWAWYRDKLSDDLWMSPGALENHLRFAAEQRPEALSTPPDQLVDNHLVERIKASGYVDQVMRGELAGEQGRQVARAPGSISSRPQSLAYCPTWPRPL